MAKSIIKLLKRGYDLIVVVTGFTHLQDLRKKLEEEIPHAEILVCIPK